MPNTNLTQAKKAKNDEFYTQQNDINREIMAYLELNPNIFRDKTILLPCDDPEWSSFTKYFAQSFDRFGIKKLISTSYAPNSKPYDTNYTTPLFEQEDNRFDQIKTKANGKIFTLERDGNKDGRTDFYDLEWKYLEGDGDFRSEEVKKLRDEADIIITNPPFSLFREFLGWIVEADKQFLIIGNMNAITYKESFSLIKDNKMWLGCKSLNKFQIPDGYNAKNIIIENGVRYATFGNICWFTNIEHGRRHEPMILMDMANNLRYHKQLIKSEVGYQKYDNYDAIEIPFTSAIPSDYEGVMGVPISFLDKYNPEQFEIVGMCENEDLYNLKSKVYTTLECKQAYLNKFNKVGTYDLNASGVITKDNIQKKIYQRILIKHKKNNN